MKGHPDDFLADQFEDFGALDAVDWMIETQGWAVTSAPPVPAAEPPRPAYSYTVGLGRLVSYPDIMLCGLSPSAANGLLSMIVGLLAGGTDLPVGPELVGVLDNDLRCRLAPIADDRMSAWMPLAPAWYAAHPANSGASDMLGAVQLLYPDRQGFLPYEDEFDSRMRFAQPLIGDTA